MDERKQDMIIRTDRGRTGVRGAVVASAMLVLATACLPGCNTVQGAGEDIEAAGEGISDAADGD